ncbi:hypothetical protein AL523_13710 [Enterococcus gallinarum]|nr:hypothetical protein AL523_13710 [Enterococcus gallinarum]
MINAKKIGKWVGIVFLFLAFAIVVITFMPIVQVLTYYLIQVALLTFQVAIALLILKVALWIVLVVFNKKKAQVPLSVKKVAKKVFKIA